MTIVPRAGHEEPRPPNVLVIEDDDDLALGVLAILSEGGRRRVEHAPTAQAARVALARNYFDAVLVDLALPVADCTLVDAGGHRIIEPGEFELLVGPSSRDEVLLRAGFVVAG